jgi:hypothetical protein
MMCKRLNVGDILELDIGNRRIRITPEYPL